MVVGQRIESLLEAKGWSQAELARRIGVSQQTIWKLVSGHSHGTKHLHLIARELETSPEYLTGETDDPSPLAGLREGNRGYQPVSTDIADTEDESDLIAVHEIDLSLGMGMTYLDVPVKEKVRRFDRQWLRDYTGVNPARVFCAQGIGSSMSPYIESHDLLFIDTAQDTIRMSEQVWAITYGNCGSVKRLFPMADGSVKMRSDNPAVPDEIAYDGELQVIGRVVAIMRKM